MLPDFDSCIDLINEIAVEDLFGSAAADRDAEGKDCDYWSHVPTVAVIFLVC